MTPTRKKTTPKMMIGKKPLHRKMLINAPAPPSASSPSPVQVVDDGARRGSPARTIACLNVIEDMARFEENEDCFILGFDPSQPVPIPPPPQPRLLDLNAPPPLDHDVDLSVIAEKGPVACRDYPHSRDQCLKFPFKSTPHEKHCELCYCYVCDSAAPCAFWTHFHCNAENVAYWEKQRRVMRKYNAIKPVGSSGL